MKIFNSLRDLPAAKRHLTAQGYKVEGIGLLNSRKAFLVTAPPGTKYDDRPFWRGESLMTDYQLLEFASHN